MTESVNIEMTDDNIDLQKALYFEIIDLILIEINTRFETNNDLIDAIDNVYELDPLKLNLLTEYGILIPSNNEISVVKLFLKTRPGNNIDVFQEIYKQRVAFKTTYEMLEAVQVFACRTVVNESSFYTLTRLDASSRRSMIQQQLANLTFIAFEKKFTKNLNIDVILKKCNEKSRVLKIF